MDIVLRALKEGAVDIGHPPCIIFESSVDVIGGLEVFYTVRLLDCILLHQHFRCSLNVS